MDLRQRMLLLTVHILGPNVQDPNVATSLSLGELLSTKTMS